MKNKYIFLRHGQTIYQKEKRKTNYKKQENPFVELTEEGKEMVRVSAEKLKRENIEIIFSSPYLRTRQTSEITAKILSINKIEYDDRLIDIDLGEFMGKPQEASNEFYFKGKNLFDNRPNNGESWNDILKRTKPFLQDLERNFENKNILIVSHADPIWLMAGYLRGYESPKEFMDTRRMGNNLHPRLAEVIKV